MYNAYVNVLMYLYIYIIFYRRLLHLSVFVAFAPNGDRPRANSKKPNPGCRYNELLPIHVYTAVSRARMYCVLRFVSHLQIQQDYNNIIRSSNFLRYYLCTKIVQ